MNSFFVFAITLGLFLDLAVIAHRETRQIPSYSASDRAGMDKLIDQVTLPEVRKLPPVSKMPPKKGLHWVSLARAAAQTPQDGFTDTLTMYQQGRLK